jgi:hypothetical protein
MIYVYITIFASKSPMFDGHLTWHRHGRQELRNAESPVRGPQSGQSGGVKVFQAFPAIERL